MPVTFFQNFYRERASRVRRKGRHGNLAGSPPGLHPGFRTGFAKLRGASDPSQGAEAPYLEAWHGNRQPRLPAVRKEADRARCRPIDKFPREVEVTAARPARQESVHSSIVV
jgi:hypothetical protein